MNILIGYGNSLCRSFVENHLAAADDSVTIRAVGSMRDVFRAIKDNLHLDMIALDLEMPDMRGLSSLVDVRQKLIRQIPVALIGPNASRRTIRNMLMAKASGYLTYSMESGATLNAIKLIASGEVFVPAETITDEDVMFGDNSLTGREHDVLSGLLAGQSNKEITRHLNLSEVTIKHHLKGLRSKLGAKNRTHAVCRAIELGIS
jgi:two-component system nitrate/nitrite response regulator NarL